MPIVEKKCGVCGGDVEEDSRRPRVLLDPARNKLSDPWGYHVCAGPALAKSLTTQFVDNITAFLRAKVIVVDIEEQSLDESGRLGRFKITAGRRNATLLSFQEDNAAEGIKAYWLPWQTQMASNMTLGDDADFFFTSELTNCRFSVLDPDPKHPRVAHIAGTLSRPARGAAEARVGLVDGGGARVRRLSISEGSDIKANRFRPIEVPKKHDYRGQKGDLSSSAFVFGYRDSDGNWNFGAQLVRGNMADTGVIKHALAEDLEILNHCYRI
jgi:hypothetical protein